MGWSSYLEDMITKFDEHLHEAQSSLKKPSDNYEYSKREAITALKEAEAISHLIRDHLEDATSPELDAAHEIYELRKKVKELDTKYQCAQYQELKAKKEKTKIESDLSSKINELSRQLKDEKKKCRKAEKDFERIASKAPGAAMEAFMSDGMIKKHKPEHE
ncbi:MAG: hypothetical protein ABW076_15215 [Candidatus Thiodiazotropha sp.]